MRREMEMASHTKKRNGRNSHGQFITGHNGGPGRPRGSRNKLSEQFFADLCADWQAHGAGAIEIVRRDHPVAYLRTVATLLRPAPDPGLMTDRYAEMTDTELLDQLVATIKSGFTGHSDQLGESVGPERHVKEGRITWGLEAAHPFRQGDG